MTWLYFSRYFFLLLLLLVMLGLAIASLVSKA